MKKGDVRRQELLARMADHVLAAGLPGASLRPLAAAAGTSDRMLLHYFADKEELLTATLTLIAQRLVVVLDAAQPEPLPFDRLVPYLAALLQDAQIQPYLKLWLELASASAREIEPFRTVARQILQTFLDWIGTALLVDREDDRRPLATLALAIIEGFVLFDALGDPTPRTLALAGLTHAGLSR